MYRLAYGLDVQGFESRPGNKFFFSPKYPDRLCEEPGLLFSRYRSSFPRVMRPVRDAHHLPLSSADVKNAESSAVTTPTACTRTITFFFFYRVSKLVYRTFEHSVRRSLSILLKYTTARSKHILTFPYTALHHTHAIEEVMLNIQGVSKRALQL